MFAGRILSAGFVALLGTAILGLEAQAQFGPCTNEIMPLRSAVEKEGLAVKKVIDSKAQRSDVCTHIKRFAAAEQKFLKYVETNASWCAIPPQAVQQLKASYANTQKMRGQACAPGAAGGPQIAPGPGLSDALGTSRAPTTGSIKTGRGTFDTLGGNPLQR